QAAIAVTGDDDRARGTIDAEIAAILVEPRRVVCRHPRPGEDSLALGGEDIGSVKQGRIGRDIVPPAQLVAASGLAGRKIHRLVRWSVWVQRPEWPAGPAASKGLSLRDAEIVPGQLVRSTCVGRRCSQPATSA